MNSKLLLILAIVFAIPLSAQTWSDDVACIVYTHCSGCHRPGNIAPFSLMNYQEAADAHLAILGAVTSGEMPPWKAAPNFGSHTGNRRLTNEEIALIDAWVSNDAPEGDPVNAPAPPVFTSNWEITNPDVSVIIPTFTIPSPLQNDLYRVFAIPLTLPSDEFIIGLEVIPGNRSVVHHVLVYSDTSGQALAQDAADPLPGYTAFGGIGVSGTKLVGSWVPGSGALIFPQGMGVRLPQNTTLAVQIHYPAASAGAVDSTRINLRLSNGALREVYMGPILNHVINIDQPLVIPANEVKTFHEQQIIPQTVSILGIGPHAHLLCTSMKSFGITLTGDTIPFVDIPEWDFHWQGQYQFQKLIKLPAFTKLHGYATYDNTENNPDNPSSPPQTVSIGEATTDEMMLFYFGFLEYLPGDENLIIDTVSHLAHHLDCVPGTVLPVKNDPAQIVDFQVFPNPAGDYFTLKKGFSELTRLRIADFSGRVVFEKIMDSNALTVSSESLPTGLYTVALFLENGRMSGAKKVVISR